ncbi:MAG: hypothetical protein QXI39_09950 [Candidatus Bathyarchaeia archaeon]
MPGNGYDGFLPIPSTGGYALIEASITSLSSHLVAQGSPLGSLA